MEEGRGLRELPGKILVFGFLKPQISLSCHIVWLGFCCGRRRANEAKQLCKFSAGGAAVGGNRGRTRGANLKPTTAGFQLHSASPRPPEHCDLIWNFNRLQFPMRIAMHPLDLQLGCNAGWGHYNINTGIIELVQKL